MILNFILFGCRSQTPSTERVGMVHTPKGPRHWRVPHQIVLHRIALPSSTENRQQTSLHWPQTLTSVHDHSVRNVYACHDVGICNTYTICTVTCTLLYWLLWYVSEQECYMYSMARKLHGCSPQASPIICFTIVKKGTHCYTYASTWRMRQVQQTRWIC